MNDLVNLMREFIDLAVEEPLVTEDEPMQMEEPQLLKAQYVLEEVATVIEKLREYMDPDQGDYALGVEMGMQRAADILENMIRRLQTETDH